MGIDINALRAKLNKLNKTNNKEERDAAFWKPTEGKHTIRIVPLKGDSSAAFIELLFHYNLGNKSYLSPLSFGRRDPIAEFAEKLSATGTKEDWLAAKPFRPQARTFVPIIVRGEEEKGVRLWSFGVTVYKQLLEFMTDDDIGDIVDVKNGRDLVITHLPAEKSDLKVKGKGLPKSTVMYKPSQTPLSSDPQLVNKWLTEQPDVTTLYEEPSYQELSVVLEKYLNPDVTPLEESTSSNSDPEETSQETSVTGSTKKPTLQQDMSKFDNLFDD